jgi:hypothetical protein
MPYDRLVDQLRVFNCFPSRGVKNLLLDVRVNLERGADFGGKLFLAPAPSASLYASNKSSTCR